jgi:hypothetical protein
VEKALHKSNRQSKPRTEPSQAFPFLTHNKRPKRRTQAITFINQVSPHRAQRAFPFIPTQRRLTFKETLLPPEQQIPLIPEKGVHP